MASVAESPAVAFTSTGKNTMTTTTAAFDSHPKPNHITRIGAVPTIGSAAMKLPTGRRPRLRSQSEEATATAASSAAAQPMAQPVSAPRRKVCTKSAQSVGTFPAMAPPMAEGAGRMTDGTS